MSGEGHLTQQPNGNAQTKNKEWLTNKIIIYLYKSHYGDC